MVLPLLQLVGSWFAMTSYKFDGDDDHISDVDDDNEYAEGIVDT